MNFDNFEQYLRNEKGYSSNTIIAYLNDLTQFAKIIKNECGVDSELEEIGRAHV